MTATLVGHAVCLAALLLTPCQGLANKCMAAPDLTATQAGIVRLAEGGVARVSVIKVDKPGSGWGICLSLGLVPHALNWAVAQVLRLCGRSPTYASRRELGKGLPGQAPEPPQPGFLYPHSSPVAGLCSELNTCGYDHVASLSPFYLWCQYLKVLVGCGQPFVVLRLSICCHYGER